MGETALISVDDLVQIFSKFDLLHIKSSWLCVRILFVVRIFVHL